MSPDQIVSRRFWTDRFRMGLKGMFFDLDESVIGTIADADFSAADAAFFIRFLSAKYSQDQSSYGLAVRKKCVFFHLKLLKKHGSEGQDDFGMARKSNSGMKKLTCAAQKHIVRRIVLILMPTSWSWSCKARPAVSLLKWRLSLCRSSENILYHLKGENVPKSTEQFLCASSFFFISEKWTKVSAWSLVEKKHVSFARLACLCVLACVVVLQNDNFEGKNRRRPSAGNSNRF